MAILTYFSKTQGTGAFPDFFFFFGTNFSIFKPHCAYIQRWHKGLLAVKCGHKPAAKELVMHNVCQRYFVVRFFY